jgi:hypothetical protein
VAASGGFDLNQDRPQWGVGISKQDYPEQKPTIFD